MTGKEWSVHLMDIGTDCKRSVSNVVTDIVTEDGFSIMLDGYVIPRAFYFRKYQHLSQLNLINELYKAYGMEFINYLKGVFVIVMLSDSGFRIFTDRHGIGKYFVYSEGNNLLVSNSLSIIAKKFALVPDKENAAIFTILSHFINGATLFKNVSSSQPGECLVQENGVSQRLLYWQPANLFHNKKLENNPIHFYAEKWKELVLNYVSYLKPEGISLTLTGGTDSRMVLAALLSGEADFHSYTYGNPASSDAMIASELSKTGLFEHNVYHMENPTENWFLTMGEELISLGNSLVNIHRAHRYSAALQERDSFPHNEMIFNGLMGGEYSKKPNRDGGVVPELMFYLQQHDKKTAKDHIKKLLLARHMKIEQLDIELIYDKLMEFVSLGNNLSFNKKLFIFTYMFYGCAHHIQDSVIYRETYKYVVNPFMDIDYLELISRYKGWYPNLGLRFYNRLFHSSFLVAITDDLSPKLSLVSYAKRGEFNAKDLLYNKLGYLIKRLKNYILFKKRAYPPSFSLGEWMSEFCRKSLKTISGCWEELYDKPSLFRALEIQKGMQEEASWHEITNPINLMMIHKRYVND